MIEINQLGCSLAQPRILNLIVRPPMRNSSRPLILACVITSACATQADRIDATSDQTFDKSFAKVVRSLHGYEPRQFALGLFGVLLPRNCLSTQATIHLTFAPIADVDGPLLQSCREQLQGKSYEDIIKEGKSKSP
jgi:hypothetical protein